MKTESTIDEDFNPEEAEHIRAITRRANWLEQRMATSDPKRGGAIFDVKEYEALLWALYEVGAEYHPGPYAEAEPAEQPPLRPAAVEEWRPASPAGFKTAKPRRLADQERYAGDHERVQAALRSPARV